MALGYLPDADPATGQSARRSDSLILGGCIGGVHSGQDVADLRLGGEVDRENLAVLLAKGEFGGSTGQAITRSGVRPVHAF